MTNKELKIRPAWQSPHDFERDKIQALKELELLKDAVELKSEFIETDDGFTETKNKHLFKAVEKSGKIVVFYDADIGSEYESHRLFCNYLKTKEELGLFFESIEIEEYIITNDMCGGHYRYGENPKGQSITVQFSVHETINGVDREIIFSDGMWFTTMDNEELVGDIAEFGRDEYIKAFQDKLNQS